MILARRKKAEIEQEQQRVDNLKARLNARLARVAEKPAPEKAPQLVTLDKLDTREAERIKADYPAIVVCEEEEDTQAQIVDISKTGLRLRFAGTHYVPELVLLDSPAFKGFVVSAVMWQDGKEAGVKFDKTLTKKIAPAGDAEKLAALKSTLAGE